MRRDDTHGSVVMIETLGNPFHDLFASKGFTLLGRRHRAVRSNSMTSSIGFPEFSSVSSVEVLLRTTDDKFGETDRGCHRFDAIEHDGLVDNAYVALEARGSWKVLPSVSIMTTHRGVITPHT